MDEYSKKIEKMLEEYAIIEAKIDEAKIYVKEIKKMVDTIHRQAPHAQEANVLYINFKYLWDSFKFDVRVDHQYGLYDPDGAMLTVEKIRDLVKKSRLCKQYMLKHSTFHGIRMHPVHHALDLLPPLPHIGNPGGKIFHKYAKKWAK